MRIRVRGTWRRVGNSVGVIVPVEEARRAGIPLGTTLDVELKPVEDSPLGLAADLYNGPYNRREEEPKLAE